MTSQRKNAASLFETFHLKQAGEPVYPFHKRDGGNFEVQAKLPPMQPMGEAVRVMYRSDKWDDSGSAHDYYHDHKSKGRVSLWLPGDGEDFPHKWPEAVTLLGSCIRWFYKEPNAADGDVVEGVPSNCILVASPRGYVSALSPSRVFLAVIDTGTGDVECLIEGDTLRLTKRGIEG